MIVPIKHNIILIITRRERLSLNATLPHNADNTILPPVINGYNTVAGSVFAPSSCRKYDAPPAAADKAIMRIDFFPLLSR